MNYWRCQCGKQQKWESGMPPFDCEGCDECGTTLARGAGGHRPKTEQHEWIEESTTRTLPDGSTEIHRERAYCAKCYSTRREDKA